MLAIFVAIPFLLGEFPLRSQLVGLLGLPCMLHTFSLAAFKILSLSWNFAILIMMYLAVGLFGFLLIRTLYASWSCVKFSLMKLGKFSIITFSNRFSIPCSSSSPCGIPIKWILLRFMLSCSSLIFLSFSVFFPFLVLSGSFFSHLVFLLTDLILCFI